MARTSIGSLVVDMRMDLGRLRTDVAKGRREFRTFSRGASNDLKRIGGGFTLLTRASAAFVGIVASGRAVGAVRRLSTEVADLGEAADRVGISAENIQGLDFGARQRGIEFNTLAMALQRASRRIGEVNQGGGELKSTMDQYGIAVRDSEGRTRSTMDVLEDFADVIANAESEQERLRIAFKLFDSEGARLVTLFGQGRAGLAAFRQEAEATGAVLSNELVAKAQDVQADFERLAVVLETRAKEGAVLLATALRDLGVVLGVGADPGALPLTMNVEELREELERAKAASAEATAELERFKDAAVSPGGAATILGTLERDQAAAAAQARVGALQARIDMLTRGGTAPDGTSTDVPLTPAEAGVVESLRFERDQMRLSAEQQRINLELRRAQTAADTEAGAQIAALVGQIQARTEAEELGERVAEGFKERQAEAEAVIAATRTETEIYSAEIARLNVLLREGRIDQETFSRAVKQADETLRDANEGVRALEDGFNRGLNAAIRGSIRDFRDLGRIAIGIIQDIIAAQFALGGGGGGSNFLSLLTAGISFAFGGGAGPQFTGTGAAGLQSAGSFAGGGDFTIGGPGGTDRSPVLFMGTRGEDVSIRNSRQKGGSGSVTFEQHFDLRGSDPGTVVQARRFADDIVRRSVAATIQAFGDGGAAAIAAGRRRG